MGNPSRLRSVSIALGAALLVSIVALIGTERACPQLVTDSAPQDWVYPKLMEIRVAIELYRLEKGSFPPSLNTLEPNYIRKLSNDHWNNPFVYRPVLDKVGYVLYSRGRNGNDESGSGDDITTEWKQFTCEQYQELCWTPCKVTGATSLFTGLLSAIVLLGILAISRVASQKVGPIVDDKMPATTTGVRCLLCALALATLSLFEFTTRTAQLGFDGIVISGGLFLALRVSRTMGLGQIKVWILLISVVAILVASLQAFAVL